MIFKSFFTALLYLTDVFEHIFDGDFEELLISYTVHFYRVKKLHFK